jgi:hypothetical protein
MDHKGRATATEKTSQKAENERGEMPLASSFLFCSNLPAEHPMAMNNLKTRLQGHLGNVVPGNTAQQGKEGMKPRWNPPAPQLSSPERGNSLKQRHWMLSYLVKKEST